MKQVAPLRYDVIFKKAFSDIEVFTGFVRDFLNINLEIDRIETEKTFAEPVGKVSSRYDLFAEDQKNRVIVDIQHVRYADHYHRFLHYHCAAILEQATSFNEYNSPLTVFTLVVLTSGDKYQQDLAIIDFDPKTLAGKPLGEIAHKVMYICPKYVTAQTPEPYREWMRAIDDSLDGQVDETAYSNHEILKVFQLIEQSGLSSDDRARILQEHREDDYRKSKYEESWEQGRTEGWEKGQAKFIRSMLTNGMNKQQIAELINLELADIERLLAGS